MCGANAASDVLEIREKEYLWQVGSTRNQNTRRKDEEGAPPGRGGGNQARHSLSSKWCVVPYDGFGYTLREWRPMPRLYTHTFS